MKRLLRFVLCPRQFSHIELVHLSDFLRAHASWFRINVGLWRVNAGLAGPVKDPSLRAARTTRGINGNRMRTSWTNLSRSAAWGLKSGGETLRNAIFSYAE